LLLASFCPSGQRLVVGVVGGSISSGHGAEDAPNWVDRVEKFLQDAYGKNSTLSEWSMEELGVGTSD
jgi:hypothetical protein